MFEPHNNLLASLSRCRRCNTCLRIKAPWVRTQTHALLYELSCFLAVLRSAFILFFYRFWCLSLLCNLFYETAVVTELSSLKPATTVTVFPFVVSP